MKLDIREDISQSDIENLVKVTKASGYKLCSAYTGEGIDDLFNLIIKTGVSNKKSIFLRPSFAKELNGD